MLQRARLIATILFAGAALASSLKIATEPPEVALEFCRNCNINADCKGYAEDSTCAQGQCTNKEGLLGRDCLCDDASECSTGRCDGIFQKTCRLRMQLGATCNVDTDCLSGFCRDNAVCADPTAPTTAPKETPTSRPKPLPIVTASPKTEQCQTCAHSSQCGDDKVCVKGICADASGELPAYCGSCKEHGDCVNGYFCAGNGLMGKTGRLCERKKRNGGACVNNDVCRSNHCNMLFQCESKIPEHKRGTQAPVRTDGIAGEATAALENTHSPGILLWVSVLVALLVFGCLAYICCQKDGLKKRFGKSETTKGSKKKGRKDDEGSDVESSTGSLSISVDPSKTQCPGVTFIAVLQDERDIQEQHTMEF